MTGMKRTACKHTVQNAGRQVGHQGRAGLPDKRVLRLPKAPRGGSVGGHHAALRIEIHNPYGRVVEDGLQLAALGGNLLVQVGAKQGNSDLFAKAVSKLSASLLTSCVSAKYTSTTPYVRSS